MIYIKNLKRFYPYEEVHVRNAVLRFEDHDNKWYDGISKALKRYSAGAYDNATENDFRPEMDNKITIRMSDNIFITYWDNTVYIGDEVWSVKHRKPMSCSLVKHKYSL